MDERNTHDGVAVEMQGKSATEDTGARTIRNILLKYRAEGLDELEARIDGAQAKSLELERTLERVVDLLGLIAPGKCQCQQPDVHDVAKGLAEEAVEGLKASLG